MSQTYRYSAFVSYTHADAVWAKRIHRWLESYSLPKGLGDEIGLNVGSAERRLAPVFLDHEEMAGASELDESITQALVDSQALIVVCSPAACRAEWVDLEVSVFKKLAPGRPIVPVIVSGEPYSQDSTNECLVAPLLSGEGPRLVCPDVRKDRDDFELAMLKTVAGIFRLSVAKLSQREAKRRAARTRAAVAILSAALAIAVGLATWAVLERIDANAQRDIALDQTKEATKQRDLAEKNERAEALQKARAEANAASAVASAKEAERSARVANAARIAAESELASNAGPEQIRRAISSVETVLTDAGLQGLMNASSQHSLGKRYEGQSSDLIDNEVYSIPGTQLILLRNEEKSQRLWIKGQPTQGDSSKKVPIREIDLQAFGGDKDKWSALIINQGVRLIRGPTQLAAEHCRFELFNPLVDREPQHITVDRCAYSHQFEWWSSGGHLYLSHSRRESSLALEEIRYFDVERKLWNVMPGKVDGKAIPGLVSVRAFSDDGQRVLATTYEGDVWVLAASGPQRISASVPRGAQVIGATSLGWWALEKQNELGLRVLTGFNLNATVPACKIGYAPYVGLSDVHTFGPQKLPIQTLKASDETFSLSRNIVAVIHAQDTPTLTWCDIRTGRTESIGLPGVPTTLRFSRDEQYLAWTIDDKVWLYNLRDRALVIAERVVAGNLIEKMFFTGDAKQIVAVTESGFVASFCLQRIECGSVRTGIAVTESAPEGVQALGLSINGEGTHAAVWNGLGEVAMVNLQTSVAKNLRWSKARADISISRISSRAADGCVVNDRCDQLERVDLHYNEDRETWFVNARNFGFQIVNHREPGMGWTIRARLASVAEIDRQPLVIAISLTPQQLRTAESDEAMPLLNPGVKATASVANSAGLSYSYRLPVRRSRTLKSDGGAHLRVVSSKNVNLAVYKNAQGLEFALAAKTHEVVYQSGIAELSICPLRDAALPCDRLRLPSGQQVEGLDISDDGQYVAVLSEGSLNVWTRAGILLSRVPIRYANDDGLGIRQAADIAAVKFLPNGRGLLMLSLRGYLKVVPIHPDHQAAALRSIAGSPFLRR